MTNAVLWLEVFIFAFFVALRLYTRISLLNAVGVDDYLVVLALVSVNLSLRHTYAKTNILHFRLFIFCTQSLSP
jgi:putative effector of murein hydrolase